MPDQPVAFMARLMRLPHTVSDDWEQRPELKDQKDCVRSRVEQDHNLLIEFLSSLLCVFERLGHMRGW